MVIFPHERRERERGFFIDAMCQFEQEAGGRQMLRIMYQSTASKIVPQMRILMRGSVRGSRNSLIMLSQLHLFSLCVCVCVCLCVCVSVCVRERM